MEIFAAKANALMSRAAARDLYDFNNMIYFGLFDESEYELLRKKDNFRLEERKTEAKIFIEKLMILTLEEAEYLELFEAGDYRPELLFKDENILRNVTGHPMALWKIKNEKKMKMVFEV